MAPGIARKSQAMHAMMGIHVGEPTVDRSLVECQSVSQVQQQWQNVLLEVSLPQFNSHTYQEECLQWGTQSMDEGFWVVKNPCLWDHLWLQVMW